MESLTEILLGRPYIGRSYIRASTILSMLSIYKKQKQLGKVGIFQLSCEPLQEIAIIFLKTAFCRE